MTARLATFEWHTPPPTSVDEVLAIYDDDEAMLVVRRPRTDSATIGSYAIHVSAEDRLALAAAGPGPHAFDLLAPPTDSGMAELMAAADRVASKALATPLAVVTFHAHSPGPNASGGLGVTLLAVGAGTQAVEFELDPARCSVQFFAADGQPVSWQDLPALPTGFVTPDATGLGGVRRMAVIAPSAYGAIAFVATPPRGAARVAVLVAGRLSRAFPDESAPEHSRSAPRWRPSRPD